MSINALSGLLNILTGSALAGGTKGASKATTAGGIKQAKLKKAIGTLQKDLRTSIDANLPVFYLVNTEVVFNAMLDEIQPSKGNLLSKYFTSIKVGADSFNFSDIEGTKEEIKNPFGTVISSKSTSGFIDLYTEKYNTILKDKSNIIKDLNSSLKENTGSTSFKKLSDDVGTLNASFTKKMAALYVLDTGALDSAVSREASTLLRAVGTLLRRYFKSTGISRITDADILLADYDSSKHTLVVGANYNRTVDVVHRALTDVLEKYIKTIGITPFAGAEGSSGSTGFKAGNFAAAGHSALRSGSSIIGINTPQSMIASMILSNNSLDAPDIIRDFVLDTGHNDWAISVKEDYTNSSKIFLGLGISFLQSQPSVYNSGVLSSEETSYFKEAFKSRFNKDIRELRKKLTENIKDPKIFSYIFKVFKLSPSLEESLEKHILAALGGPKFKGPAKSAKFNTNNSSSSKLLTIVPKTKQLAKVKSAHKKIPIRRASIRNLRGQFTSLASLQLLINSQLQDVISANMGDGDRRDILNYRTGRFAASTKVEYMSESRTGMITAFYSYMKNPYATFSQGGRQSAPRSRDPKLLIARSIRDIASQHVSNALRSVNV